MTVPSSSVVTTTVTTLANSGGEAAVASVGAPHPSEVVAEAIVPHTSSRRLPFAPPPAPDRDGRTSLVEYVIAASGTAANRCQRGRELLVAALTGTALARHWAALLFSSVTTAVRGGCAAQQRTDLRAWPHVTQHPWVRQLCVDWLPTALAADATQQPRPPLPVFPPVVDGGDPRPVPVAPWAAAENLFGAVPMDPLLQYDNNDGDNDRPVDQLWGVLRRQNLAFHVTLLIHHGGDDRSSD